MAEKKEMEEHELRDKIEAILFSAAKKVSEEELKEMMEEDSAAIKRALESLREKYEQDKGPVMLLQEGHLWKLTVREKFTHIIQKIVTETELSKTIMETLAIIAFKHPIMQAELVRIRSNKAYDHVRDLEEMGYITREPVGRTKKIKLTQKFFDYFDLPPSKVRDAFASFEAVEQAIEEKENEAQAIKSVVEKRMEEVKKEKDKEKAKLGELEVFDEPSAEGEGEAEKKEEGKEKEKEEIQKEEPKEEKEKKLGDMEIVDVKEEEPEQEEEETEKHEKAPEDEKVDKIVEEILHPETAPEHETGTVNLAGIETPEKKEEKKDILEEAEEEIEEMKKES